MKQAARSDKTLVVATLLESFAQDPHVNWIIGTGGNQQARLRALIDYSFETAWPGRDIYYAEDGAGVALWKKPGLSSSSPRQWWSSVRFLAQMGFHRMRSLMEAETYIEHHRPAQPHWYLWYIGVRPERQGQGISNQLLDPMLAQMDATNQVVCLETASTKNVGLYERKGFRVYHEYTLPGSTDVCIRMMSRQPRLDL